MLAGQLANRLEVPRLGEHDAEVHHRCLHDHAGRLAALVDHPLDTALHRARVVERHGNGHVDHGLGDSLAVRERGEVVAVADALVGDADRDHHVVVVAVVRAEDLDDRVPSGGGAGDPDRVHRRFRAGVDVAPLRQPETPRELLADDEVVLDRGGEVGAELDALLHRLRDGGVRVALHHRAEAVVEVEHDVAVDVPDARALSVGEIHRPGLAHLVGGRDPVRERLLRPLVHVARAGCPVVEARLLARRKLANPLLSISTGVRVAITRPPRSVRPGRRRGRAPAPRRRRRRRSRCSYPLAGRGTP